METELINPKPLEELRRSDFHRELGHKMGAAYIAQMQGVSLSTAMKKVAEFEVGDLWLCVADYALRLMEASIHVHAEKNPPANPVQ